MKGDKRSTLRGGHMKRKLIFELEGNSLVLKLETEMDGEVEVKEEVMRKDLSSLF